MGMNNDKLNDLLKQANDIRVLHPVVRSDHGIVIGEFICKWKSRIVPKKIPIYTRGRYDNIANRIKGINWKELATDLSARELLQLYNGKYNVLTAENIPLGSPREYNEPWMNRDIMKVWKKKAHAWNRVGERGSGGRWGEYRHHRDHLRKTIRKSR